MQHAVTEDGSKSGEVRALNDLTREWVEIGWRHTLEEPFDFRERLARFYDWSSGDTQFFDDFDPKRRVNTDVAQYAAIWDTRIPSMQSLTNVTVGNPHTLVSGGLAVTSVQFVTSYTTADGAVEQAQTLSSLVWRRSPEGWRIIREHGSGLAIRD
ncbi:nuclear transport factor 2 family protein [Belnapia sp. T18]|uniref:Nuclear transport factor 2 family protein n=1 Tax=Belnapia arida TaxID=2804533 RepID=A0ABS1UBA4_9PROT|nr:nuclear transport factor 2 family protein [Belnapia arida]MBL6081219.1 nuclear transport factor 2 family protein [Belnapia arida]